VLKKAGKGIDMEFKIEQKVTFHFSFGDGIALNDAIDICQSIADGMENDNNDLEETRKEMNIFYGASGRNIQVSKVDNKAHVFIKS